MKIRLETKALVTALKKLQPITGAATTLPVLKCVLITAAENGTVKLAASNLDIALELTASEDSSMVENSGSIAVPLGLLLRLAGGMGAEIALESDSKHFLKVESGSRTAKIMGLSAEEFPAIPAEDGTARVLPAELADWLARLLPMVSADPTRFVLCGVCFAARDGKPLTLVATNGRLLAKMETGIDFAREIILPTQAARALLPLLLGFGCTMRHTESMASFRGADWLLVAKVIEGQYPNFEMVIPATVKGEVSLPTAAVLSALAYVGATATEKAMAAKLTFTKDSLEITANAPDVGESRDVLAIEGGPKAGFTIAFDPDYLGNALKGVPEGEARMGYTSEIDPVKITSGDGYTAAVCPMRIS